MRHINLETWPRRRHFEFFSTYDQPHFGLCTNLDITALRPLVKQKGASFTIAITYILTRVANEITEFKYRIRAATVVEHECIHPSLTIMTTGDLFNFCPLTYVEPFGTFATLANTHIKQAHMRDPLQDEAEHRDDLLFMSSIPWISFTSFKHPMKYHPADSIPRLTWGKVFSQGEQLQMPLSVQVHHGLMDGIHLGRFYEKVQAAFQEPDHFLNP